MIDAAIVERSRWHYRAVFLELRRAWRALGRRWSALHPTDRRALVLVLQFGAVLAVYLPGVLCALP